MTVVEPPFRRPYFRPTVPSGKPEAGDELDTISSLPNLIRYNAKENPDHIFCVQAELISREAQGAAANVSRYDARRITFRQLDKAVDTCATWIHKMVKSSSPKTSAHTPRPIALYLESDIGLFIHLAALLAMDIPVGSP